MDRRTVGSTLVISGSLFLAMGASAIVVVATAPPSVPATQMLPYGIEMEIPPVVAANDRAVSKTVLATADALVTARAPGLALVKTELSRGWEKNRAVIQDLTTGDVRAYAIGDLLPHGSLLVGLSTGTADIMIADVELVRLSVGGAPSSIEDFRTAWEAEALKRAPDLDSDYRAAIEGAVRILGSAGAETVQANIDELVECGDPAVEVLIQHVGDGESVVPGSYEVPTGSGTTIEPQRVGDVIIAVLEVVTGQTFGDPVKASATDRAEIARAWERWWGLP